MWIELRRAALAALLVVGAASADESDESDESRQGGSISLLSYNVHGLFPLAAKDDPRDRMPTIGWLANRYEIAMFQEDFEYHDVLQKQLPNRVGFRGNGIGWDPRRVLAKLLISPVSIFLPDFSPPYGAGLSIFVREPLVIPGDFAREAFGVCHGWLGSNGDCWARKGYQRVAIRTPEGAEVDVYNTHLESGGSERSVRVRRAQLDVLARAIEARSSSRAVIVGGDFNSAFNRVGDRDNLIAFRRRLALVDSGAGPENPFWRERNYILYRNGDSTKLEIDASGEAREFVGVDRALSDHPALYARFRAVPSAKPEAAEP